MRTSLLTFLMAASGYAVTAQQFQEALHVPLTDGVTTNIEWADFDNDSLLDVVIIGVTANEEYTFSIYRNENGGLSPKTTVSTTIANGGFWVGDMNADNQIDLVFSGMTGTQPITVAYTNLGNFVFEENLLTAIQANTIDFSDLDQDGYPEMILSGSTQERFFDVFKHGVNNWTRVLDSIKIAAIGIEAFDFDNDTDNDLFISGTNVQGAHVSEVYYNERKFFFRKDTTSAAFSGTMSLSDLNHDGYMDILIAGADDQNNPKTGVLMNQGRQFVVKDSIPVVGSADIFTGDFNSDGLADVNLSGVNGADTVNLLVFNDGSYDTLPSTSLLDQAFGDFDRDGDLDCIQLINGSQVDSLSLLQNAAPAVNKGPSSAFNPIAAVLFNRIFLYWEKPTDDHTGTSSLTYDVSIQGTGADVLTPSFDLLHLNRLLVSHGNTGHANFLLLRSSVSSFDFAIQTVDNAYHTGHADPGNGICRGSGSGLSCPVTIGTEKIVACRNESMVIEPGGQALWFSFNRGFLQESSSFEFTATGSDTIFSVEPGSGADLCAAISLYMLEVRDSLTKITDIDKYVCEGVTLELAAEPGFTIEWSSANKGFLSIDPAISFTVTEPDTVKLKLSDGSGCNLLRRTALKISEPALQLSGTAFQILKGESVQLVATGGESYVWSPVTGLGDPLSGTTSASPSATTQYTVTATDSLGCQASGRVLVIVEQSAFVPNLFTPNEDGKNDELKVYGLYNVNGFQFSIYNREGALVYSTRNISEAGNTGWDGSTRGVKQPAGIYYWKIEGETGSGIRILLNGKSSGSLVLIR